MMKRQACAFGVAVLLVCLSALPSAGIVAPNYLGLVGARERTAGRICDPSEICSQWAWWGMPDGAYRLYHSASEWEARSRHYEQYRETPEFVLIEGWTAVGEQVFYRIVAQDVWIWTSESGWVDRTADFRHGPVPHVQTFLGQHHRIWVRARLWDTVNGGWAAQYQEYREWQMAPITTFHFGSKEGLLGYQTFEYLDHPHGSGPGRYDSVTAHVQGVMYAWTYGWFGGQPTGSPKGTKYVWRW